MHTKLSSNSLDQFILRYKPLFFLNKKSCLYFIVPFTIQILFQVTESLKIMNLYLCISSFRNIDTNISRIVDMFYREYSSDVIIVKIYRYYNVTSLKVIDKKFKLSILKFIYIATIK